MQDNKIYRIQDMRNGLYRRGGNCGWSKKGKIWTSLGHVKNHIGLFIQDESGWPSRQKSEWQIAFETKYKKLNDWLLAEMAFWKIVETDLDAGETKTIDLIPWVLERMGRTKQAK